MRLRGRNHITGLTYFELHGNERCTGGAFCSTFCLGATICGTSLYSFTETFPWGPHAQGPHAPSTRLGRAHARDPRTQALLPDIPTVFQSNCTNTHSHEQRMECGHDFLTLKEKLSKIYSMPSFSFKI